MKIITLTLTGSQRDALKAHLFPGDGKRPRPSNHAGATTDPHGIACSRARCTQFPTRSASAASTTSAGRSNGWTTWPIAPPPEGSALSRCILTQPATTASRPADDKSDRNLFPGIHALVEVPVHASVVMLPDGALFGRSVGPEGEFTPLERITIVGDDIEIYHAYLPRSTETASEGRRRPSADR